MPPTCTHQDRLRIASLNVREIVRKTERQAWKEGRYEADMRHLIGTSEADDEPEISPFDNMGLPGRS